MGTSNTASSRDAAHLSTLAGAVGKRERNSKRIREQIVAAARESFCELGFGASTVRDIMRRAGLASGTFYNYFHDKESVLNEIVVEFAARVRAHVHLARMKATSLEALIHEAFRATFSLYAQDRLLVTLVTRNSGDVRQLLAASVMDLAIRDLADDLEARSGEFGIAGLDLESFALAGVALAGEFGFRMIQKRPFDIEHTTEFVSGLMLAGIERMSTLVKRGAGSQPEAPETMQEV
ncbi:MAG TPA: TetR/AcrR family transcriptional regulator [Candidatus Binatia bacterium]